MAAFLLTINIFNRFMFVYFGVFFSCSKTMCRCLRVAVKRVLSTTLDGQESRSLRLLVSHAWMRLLSLTKSPRYDLRGSLGVKNNDLSIYQTTEVRYDVGRTRVTQSP